MRLYALKYLLIYLAPAIVAFSMAMSGWWSYSAVVLLFGIIPFLELFTKGSTRNMAETEEEIAKKDSTYDILVYGLVPVQYAIMIFFSSASAMIRYRYTKKLV